MQKRATLALLLLFFSVQIYQVCDDSNDACEAVVARLQTLSSEEPHLAAPIPIDDPDASLPFIVGQALGQAKLISLFLLSAHCLRWLTPICANVFVAHLLRLDHSPPGSHAAANIPPRNSIMLTLSPARVLAPPLAAL